MISENKEVCFEYIPLCLGMVEDTCNPSILEAEASVLSFQDQCGPHIKTHS